MADDDECPNHIACAVSRLRCLDPVYRDIELRSFFHHTEKEEHDILYRALVGSFHVRSLTIGRTWYTTVECCHLVDSLPCLEKLTMTEYCSEEAVHALATSVCKSKSIRTVCLEQQNVHKPFLCNVLTALTTLTVLELDCVEIRNSAWRSSDQGAKTSLADAYATNKSLRSLHLGAIASYSPELHRCAESMLEKEILTPKLCELSIGGSVCSGTTIELLRKLLQSTSCLAKLSVDFYTEQDDTEGGTNSLVERIQPWMDDLLMALESNQSVTHLRLQNAGLDNLNIAGKLGRFLASDFHLIELKVEGYLEVVDPRSLCHFFAGIGYNSHVRSLSIEVGSNGKVSDEVPLQLVHALQTNQTLETVTVRMNLSDSGMCAIAEAVPRFNLTDLSLSVDIGSNDLVPFTSNLVEEIGLTALSMRHCSLRGRSLCVGDFLVGNRTLCRLTIECVDEGNLAEIFGALELNTTLEYMDVALTDNPDFTHEASLRLLCASLPRFKGLKELVMYHVDVDFSWIALNQAERQAFCDNGSLQRVVNDIYYRCQEEEDRTLLDFCALRNQRAAFVDGRGDRVLWSSILTKVNEKRSNANLSVMWHCLRNRLDWVHSGLSGRDSCVARSVVPNEVWTSLPVTCICCMGPRVTSSGYAAADTIMLCPTALKRGS